MDSVKVKLSNSPLTRDQIRDAKLQQGWNPSQKKRALLQQKRSDDLTVDQINAELQQGYDPAQRKRERKRSDGLNAFLHFLRRDK